MLLETSRYSKRIDIADLTSCMTYLPQVPMILNTFITSKNSSPIMPIGNVYMWNLPITHFGEMI